ncbi:MAG: glycosyltransferase [Thermoleophilaceae bacterium]
MSEGERRPEPRLPQHLAVYSDADVLGGAELALANLLGELAPEIEVTVLGTSAPIVEAIAARRGDCRTTILPGVGDKRDLGPIAAHLRAIRRLRPDVLHANQRSPWSCQYAIAAGLLAPGVRVVSVEHSAIPSQDRWQRRLRRALMRRVAAHVAVGERAARLVEGYVGLPAGAVRTIHNGIPDHGPVPARSLAPAPVVGTITRVDRHKGLDVLLEALRELPQAHAVVVGEGPELAALLERARSSGVGDRLVAPGFDPDPRSALAGFDVFVLPSRFESFPLSILEAMLAGLPVVASEVGSVPEAVREGETGFLVPPGDAAALAGALRRLLDDAELRTQMGERGRALVRERFTAARMARDYERLYSDVLAS